MTDPKLADELVKRERIHSDAALGKFMRANLPVIIAALTAHSDGWREALAYLDEQIAMFDRDPADTRYQTGWLECLRETRRSAIRALTQKTTT